MQISSEIANCNRCKNNVPFFFEIYKQKIMLITGSSTMQASYAPLISVRFLRNLLYAMFGYEGVSEQGFERFFSETGIYWTSFNKCYDPYFLRIEGDKYAMDRFRDKKCGKYFLQQEIDCLKPQWILVIGEGVRNAVLSLSEAGNLMVKCEMTFINSFHMEDPQIVQSIREKIAKILSIPIPEEIYDRNAAYTTKNNSEVNLSFQANSILSGATMLGTTRRNTPNFENKVEEIWINGFINALKSRYYTFLDSWNSIETSLKTFLLKECDPYSLNKNFSGEIPIGGESYIESYLQMSYQLLEKVDQYYNGLQYMELKKRWIYLYRKLRILSRIRNAIIHSFGFVPYKLLYLEYDNNQYYDINNKLRNIGIKGIKLLTNMIYISEAGAEEIIQIFEEVSKLLTDTEQKKNQKIERLMKTARDVKTHCRTSYSIITI